MVNLMVTQLKDISSYALEVLFLAASSTGSGAGQIKWESAVLKHLQAGHNSWRFSSDSGRSDLYWDAVWELVGYGYVRHVGANNLGGNEYVVTDSGYDVAEDCCHEWWTRQFARVRAWRASK